MELGSDAPAASSDPRDWRRKHLSESRKQREKYRKDLVEKLKKLQAKHDERLMH